MCGLFREKYKAGNKLELAHRELVRLVKFPQSSLIVLFLPGGSEVVSSLFHS